MKFVVFSLGCKVNQYEGQSMIKELISRGFTATDKLEYADCYIINTCSVTMEADKKSRQAVSRVLKLNPDAKIVICGCSSQNDIKQYENKPNVVIIGGTSGKMALIDSIMSDIVQKNQVKTPPAVYEDDLFCELTKSRAYIKVQDGCNNFCSYCIIPYLRGRSRSRNLDAIVAEAKELADKTKEIVITGINVSDYGNGLGLTVLDLVKALSDIPVRKRFSSLECHVITDELLRCMLDGGWCDSFHLSMQSGSDAILKKMNRKYDSAFFIEKSDLIRKYFPDAGLMTDVIVGFPGETDEQFRQTEETCRRVAFSDMHVFPYSIRPGTPAAKMEQVNDAVKCERAAVLRKLAAEMKESFLTKQIGKTVQVFVEDDDSPENSGFTSNYIKVYTTAPKGTFVEQKITALYRDGVKGENL